MSWCLKFSPKSTMMLFAYMEFPFLQNRLWKLLKSQMISLLNWRKWPVLCNFQVLNETLQIPNFNHHSGVDVAQRFHNRTFNTSSGLITLDRFGDRAPSVSVSFFNDVTENFQVLLFHNNLKLSLNEHNIRTITQHKSIPFVGLSTVWC